MASTRAPSQTPAAKRARARRAEGKQSAGAIPGNAAAPAAELYTPPDDAPPMGREDAGRGPGRPAGGAPGFRRPSLRSITAHALTLINIPIAIVAKPLALSKPEIGLLSDGLCSDPWTGPWLAKYAVVGQHSELLEAVGTIVIGRLIAAGLIPFGPDDMAAMMRQAEAEHDDTSTPAAEPSNAYGADPASIFGAGASAPADERPW